MVEALPDDSEGIKSSSFTWLFVLAVMVLIYSVVQWFALTLPPDVLQKR